MKVTFATTWDTPCGIASYSRALVCELEKHVEIQVISLDPGGLRSPSRLALALNQGDVAHIQHQYPFFGGMAFHRNRLKQVLYRMEVPLVITLHELDLGESDPWPIRRYKEFFNRWLFGSEQIDRIIVHSTEYREKLKTLGVPPEDVVIVPMGVPPVVRPRVSSEAAKAEMGLSGKRVLTIFGFVVARKGYETALEAIRRLPDDVVLLIAGGPHPGDQTGFFDDLMAHIDDEHLGNRVIVTGYLAEHRIPIVMAATDIILAPFTAVSSSWSLMHSMAYGKPIVASDLPPFREINERIPALALCSPEDPADLASKIGELLSDVAKLSSLLEAVEAYADTYTIGRQAQETLAVYQELLT